MLLSILLSLASAPAHAADAPATAATATTAAAASPLAGLALTTLDGTPMPSDVLAGKAVMFVNVASKCGYTRQYDGLQKLWNARKDDGLMIVGVPCNQFGGQEPGSPEEIATFCRMEYGVDFPLLAKQSVNGAERSPLYEWLISSTAGGDKDIGWNFEKFVVDRKGNVVARFASRTTPQDDDLAKAIDAALKN
jgi:glutathione peroxidase